MDKKEYLEDRIAGVQRSTRTSFSFMIPAHEWLRNHSRLYYNWHMNPYSSFIHWTSVFLSVFIAFTALSPIFIPFGAQPQAAAGILKQFPFQGRLTTPDGQFVADGQYNVTFKIYAVPTGGTATWVENHTGSNKVTVDDGIFHVLLGSLTSLGVVDFNTDSWYLGVAVESDPEMSPRIPLGAAPFAINSDQLDGRDETAFPLIVGRAGGQTLAGGTTGSENLNLTSTSNATKGKIFFGTASAYDETSAFLGIGATVPTTALDIFGALNVRGISAPAVSPAGQGRIYFDSGTGKFRLSQAGGAYADLVTASNAFIQGGNSFGATATFGTGDSNIISFVTGGTEKMRLDTTGRLGVGVTSPGAFVDIKASTAAVAALHITTGAQPTSPAVGDLYSDGTDLFFWDGTAWRDLTVETTTGGGWTDGGTLVALTTTSDNVCLGPTATCATSGKLRLNNADFITARNAGNSANIDLLRVNSSNNIQLGTTSASKTTLDIGATGVAQTLDIVNSGAVAAVNTRLEGFLEIHNADGFSAAIPTTGSIRLRNGETITARNLGNTTNIDLLRVNSADNIQLGATSLNKTTLDFGVSVSAQTLDIVNSGTEKVNTRLEGFLELHDTNGFGTVAATGILRLPNNKTITAKNGGATADIDLLKLNTSDNIQLGATTTNKTTLDFGVSASDQTLDIANTGTAETNVRIEGFLELHDANAFTTVAGVGLLRLPNNKTITAKNAGATGDINILKINASDNLELGPTLGTTITELDIPSASTTEFDFLNSSTGKANIAVEGLLTLYDSNAFGSTPAGTGIIRIPNNQALVAKNGGATADIPIAKINTSNNLELGPTTTNILTIDLPSASDQTYNFTNSSTAKANTRIEGFLEIHDANNFGTVAGAGILRLPNNKTITAKNGGATADIDLLKLNTSDNIQLGATTTNKTTLDFGVSASDQTLDIANTGTAETNVRIEGFLELHDANAFTTVAGTGLLRLPNNKTITAKNGGATADIDLLKLNTSDNIQLGTTSTSKTTLDFGVTGSDHTLDIVNSGAAKTNTRLEGFLEIHDVNGFTTVAGAGTIRLPNNKSITAKNAGATADINLLTLNTSDKADIDTSLLVDLSATQTLNALCHTAAGPSTTNQEIVDCSGAPSDVAEWYETKNDVTVRDIVAVSDDTITYEVQGGDPKTGEVKKLGTNKLSVLRKATKDHNDELIGVISEGPFQTFGEDITKVAKHPHPVALAGRVRVKISNENGDITAGNPITISSTPGVGMKATDSGRIVGYALENSSGKDAIMILVNLGEYAPKASAPAGEPDTSHSFIDQLALNLKTAIAGLTGSITTAGTWIFDRIESVFIKTDRLQVEQGINLKDQATSEYYCVTIENGELVKTPGACTEQ